MPTTSPVLLATSLSAEEALEWRETLARAMPGETIVLPDERFARETVEIAIVANPAPGMLQDLPRLFWIQSLWAGIDRLAADPTLPDVPLVRLVDPLLAKAMAETAAAVVLSLHRDLDIYTVQQRDELWHQHPTVTADCRRVVVLGLGEMGRATAAMLTRIGFDVRGWSRSGDPVNGVRVYAGDVGLADALDNAEILVNLLPLTPRTQGVLNARNFSRLAPGACIVNFGRAGHLVERDLLDALAAGQLRRAVLDVFSHEPLPPGDLLWRHPGVTVLPHIAARTDRVSAASIVASAVASYRRTGQAPTGFDRSAGY